MAIWKARIANGVRAYFAVSSSGVLRTGLSSGVFTVRVINPTDTAFTSPTVSQSTQRSGIYYFDISSAFLTTHGAGHYGVSVGVHATGPKLDDEMLESLEVNTRDIDDLATNNSIVLASLQATSGSTSTNIRTTATQADDFYNDQLLIVVNSSGASSRQITDYSNTNGQFTVSPALPFTPSINDTVLVIGRTASVSVNTSAIADAVWQKSTSSPTAGSYGELVNQIGDLASLIPSLL
jgi:hypothetical protein